MLHFKRVGGHNRQNSALYDHQPALLLTTGGETGYYGNIVLISTLGKEMNPFIGTTEKVGIAGDWHGDTAWALWALDTFRDAGITNIFHLGDFGIWQPAPIGASFILKIQKRLAKNGQRLFITPGNHEDYARIENTPVGEHGWQEYRPGVFLAPRGLRWEMEGRSFLSLGGANSIDFDGRTENITWWKGEQITRGDEYRAMEGGKADIMLAHEAPLGALPIRHGHGGWSAKRLGLRTAVFGGYAVRSGRSSA